MATTSLQLKITRQWKSYPASKFSRVLWRQGGKRKESLQLRLWNLNPSFNSPVDHCRLSCQISAYSAKGKRAQMKTNIEKCAKGNDVITNVITANQHFRYSNSGDVVISSTSFSRTAARVPRRPCSQAMEIHLN